MLTQMVTMADLTLTNMSTWEICFTPSYIIQIGALGVRGHAGQFDHATDKVEIILLKSKVTSRPD